AEQDAREQRGDEGDARSGVDLDHAEVESELLRIERPHYQPDRKEREQDQQAEDVHGRRLRARAPPSLADRNRYGAVDQAACGSDGAGTTSLTFSRSSLPALKCGTCLPGRATDSPVFGLRPMRGGR